MKKFCLILCFFLLLLTGCGNSAEEKAIEKKIEKETGAKTEVDLSEKGMKISGTSEGERYSVTTGDATEIPKDFPEDVPIYHPAKSVAAMEVDDGYSVSLKTKDDIRKVISFYKDQIVSQGWSEKTSLDMGGHTVLAYEKDQRVANIAIMSIDKETRITLTVLYNTKD